MFLKLLLCSLACLHIVDAFLFGSKILNRRPTLNQTAKIGARRRVLSSHNRMPQYMIQLYKELTTENDGGEMKKQIPYSANAIRGLNSVVKRTSKSSMKILLNLGYFKANTSIIRDEIHLFMDSSRRQDMKPFKPYILRFKDIHTGQLIRKFKVPAFNQGWQVLSLNKWTNKWVKDPNSNKGIIVSVLRGGRGRPAVKNPFVNFPRGNGPYMILFASESVQSLLAWRFLIQNALNSVAGHTSGQTRKTRDVRRVSRGLSQQSTSGQQLAQNSSLHLLQQPQCKGVEKDMNLTNLTSGDVVIIQPKVYKSLNCPKSCIHRTVGQPSNSSQNNTGVTMVKHCCTPTQHRTLMVLLKNTTTGDIEAQVYQRFVPTACEWLR